MAVKLYGSVNGKSQEITKLYGSVNGVSKEIKKLYGSVNGVSKLIYEVAPTGPAVVVIEAAQSAGDSCVIILTAPDSEPSLRALSYTTSQGYWRELWFEPVIIEDIPGYDGEFGYLFTVDTAGDDFQAVLNSPRVTIRFDAFNTGTYTTIVD